MSHIADRGLPATTGTTVALRVALAMLIAAAVAVVLIFALRGNDHAAGTPRAVPYAHVARPDEGASALRPLVARPVARGPWIKYHYRGSH